MNVTSVILAAGYGTRMKSSLPKVMHSLLGRPMIEWALLATESLSQSAPVIVVGHGSEQVMLHLGDRANYARQEELLGTGHAVMQAGPMPAAMSTTMLTQYW